MVKPHGYAAYAGGARFVRFQLSCIMSEKLVLPHTTSRAGSMRWPIRLRVSTGKLCWNPSPNHRRTSYNWKGMLAALSRIRVCGLSAASSPTARWVSLSSSLLVADMEASVRGFEARGAMQQLLEDLLLAVHFMSLVEPRRGARFLEANPLAFDLLQSLCFSTPRLLLPWGGLGCVMEPGRRGMRGGGRAASIAGGRGRWRWSWRSWWLARPQAGRTGHLQAPRGGGCERRRPLRRCRQRSSRQATMQRGEGREELGHGPGAWPRIFASICITWPQTRGTRHLHLQSGVVQASYAKGTFHQRIRLRFCGRLYFGGIYTPRGRRAREELRSYVAESTPLLPCAAADAAVPCPHIGCGRRHHHFFESHHLPLRRPQP